MKNCREVELLSRSGMSGSGNCATVESSVDLFVTKWNVCCEKLSRSGIIVAKWNVGKWKLYHCRKFSRVLSRSRNFGRGTVAKWYTIVSQSGNLICSCVHICTVSSSSGTCTTVESSVEFCREVEIFEEELSRSGTQ